MSDNNSLKTQKLIIGLFSILLLVVLIIVAGVEMKLSRKPEVIVDISGDNKRCVTCHTEKGIALKAIDNWKQSLHAQQNISCTDCHTAKKGDFDAFYCPESDFLVAKHPTPKDCAECHAQQVDEFADSKHAHQFWLIKNADRSIFENPISTKHGCEQCHAIGNVWPDQSVGECDACHPKHTFSKAVARQPETCGECHVGPDHPHIEIYLESKHGNIFRSQEKKLDLNFSSKDGKPIPIDIPVCTTCHMDGNETQPMTHNVSARLAWESQAAWSFRTVWMADKLGDWKMKRSRMEDICKSCHSPEFVDSYLLTADLTNLQYNEIRRLMVGWNKKLTEKGIIKRLEKDGKFYSDVLLNGWDEVPEILMYHAWHHEGRRFRHGAEMMGADYTQWHGIWELQHDMVEMFTFAAEHGDPEAKKWVESTDPIKFAPYALYDIPGNAFGINVLSNTVPYVYKAYPDYWDRIKANVEKAYQNNVLTQNQFAFWIKRFENKEHYIGTKYKADSVMKKYTDLDSIDTKAFTKEAVQLELPGKPFWNW